VANIFERVIEVLNKPLPGTAERRDEETKAERPASSRAEPAPGTTTTTTAKQDGQQQARDVQREMRERERALRRQEQQAREEMREELARTRREMHELRRQYETEVAKQAQAHAEAEQWTYTVVPGDTLSGIAQRFYGNAGEWHRIHEANRDKIQNPNLIYPGQTFVIPDDDD
jgi:nucleoid-associated protein YgaU